MNLVCVMRVLGVNQLKLLVKSREGPDVFRAQVKRGLRERVEGSRMRNTKGKEGFWVWKFVSRPNRIVRCKCCHISNNNILILFPFLFRVFFFFLNHHSSIIVIKD